MGTLYIQAFYPAVGLDRKKKKKKTGWWSIEAPSANRRKEETIAAGVDVKFMTGCKHGNSLSLSLSLARSFYHSFQILPSDFHRRIASGGTGGGGRGRDEETRAWN